jgi:predicted DNA-binding transcriptional regulator AlpA
MATQYKPGNRFSPNATLADAAVEWQGLSAEQRDLVIIDDAGLPYLAGVPELQERAEAILGAVQSRKITGQTRNEDGYDLHPSNMRLNRESVIAWILETNQRIAAPAVAAAIAPPPIPDRLLNTQEVLMIVGGSRSTLYRTMGKGEFPQPTHPGKKNRWRLQVINDYVAANTRRSDSPNGVEQAEEDF